MDGHGTVALPHEPASLPLALARLHRRVEPGATVSVHLRELPPAAMPVEDLVEGAGFELAGRKGSTLVLLRLPTLPDTVGPGMAMLICGLNPSHHSVASGVGYTGPGNRFWPAMQAAGLVPIERSDPSDPFRLLAERRIGMTDLVKRPTARAADLAPEEYRSGLARLERLVAWLEPGVVCVVGLAGWRTAADRSAVAGPLDRRLGGRPVHLMPSTSGLNAATPLAALTDHLRRAAASAGHTASPARNGYGR